LNNNINRNYSLRKAESGDERLLFNWTNDPIVRSASFENKIIDFNSHQRWFKKKINDQNVLIFIFEGKNIELGMVRFEKKKNHILLNYSLASNARGKKLASIMLKMSVNKIRNSWKNLDIFAYTLPENIPSNRALLGAGFSLDVSTKNKNLYIC
tara:strand:+ start:17674 stop:18135 length:462 start_codon:yes stop_codon:yes gene_type:complete